MPHRVLLVDDEPNVTDALKRALYQEPYEVWTAHSGQEALGLLSRGLVDVIVADEKMPGMSGTELLTIVRRISPETIRMILTGYATVEAAIAAINDAGIHYFFTKPYNDVELATSIRHALEMKSLKTRAQHLLELIKELMSTQEAEVKRLEEKLSGAVPTGAAAAVTAGGESSAETLAGVMSRIDQEIQELLKKARARHH